MLPQKFYNKKTLHVAQKLLGNILVYKTDKGILSGKIVETDAYIGPNDKASHASRGKTPRNKIMFGPAGFWYIYLIYGMYNCLNIVTEKNTYPAAVLIRALEPIKGVDIMKKNRETDKITNLCSGPGKLCQAFGITKELNGSKAFGKTKLNILKSKIQIPNSKIKENKRVGIDYAGEFKDKMWRFYIKNNDYISKI